MAVVQNEAFLRSLQPTSHLRRLTGRRVVPPKPWDRIGRFTVGTVRLAATES